MRAYTSLGAVSGVEAGTPTASCSAKTGRMNGCWQCAVPRTGLEIAEEDLKLRGAGNLFGTEQSGMNEYIDLVLSYPEEYKKMKAIVNELF